MGDKKDSSEKNHHSSHLTRKEMILKTGRYAVFTAVAMMSILGSAKGDDPPTPGSPGLPEN